MVEAALAPLHTKGGSPCEYILTPPTVPIDAYNNTVQCHLTEVFEVRSFPITINRACVRDIAFVFHINSLERVFPDCSGMTRVFFIRFFMMTTIGCLRYITTIIFLFPRLLQIVIHLAFGIQYLS
jgi:hypothetical protein